MGKRQKQDKNDNLRANQVEPKPNMVYAGIRRLARYIKRTTKAERKAQ